MRIAIDMQGAQTIFSKHRGVGRYTMDLVKEIVNNAGNHEIFLALNGFFESSIVDIKREFKELLPEENIRVWQQFYDFAGVDLSSIYKMDIAEISREVFLNSLKPDFIFSTNLQEGFFEPAPTSVKRINSNVQFVTVLHDVIPLLDPDKYLQNTNTRNWYDSKINAVKKSDIILTGSNFSKKEISRLCDIPLEKINVVYDAVDHNKFRVKKYTVEYIEKLFEKYNLTKDFILYSGGGDQHKNLPRLFEAFSLLPIELRDKYSLVMVGKEIGNNRVEFEKKLSSLGIKDQVIFTGYVSDDELICLYNTCHLFVFPSITEGFGLPLLEAMSCGAAVVSSNTSSLIEINQRDDTTFDPFDVEQISNKIESVLIDDVFYKALKEYSLIQAKKFSWKKAAVDILSILEKEETIKKSNRTEYFFDNPISSILDYISNSNYPCTFNERELISISQSLVETYPTSKDRKPRLYLDVSAVEITRDRTGIQRVVRSICNALIPMHSFFYEIIPIFTSPQDAGFKLAKETLLEITDGVNPYNEDYLIDFFSGDVLLYLDLHPSVAISKVNQNQYLMNKGIKIFHIVYDLLPLKYPQYFWPDLCSEFNEWFKSIIKSDGVICISKSVAYDVQKLVNTQEFDANDHFMINWFHLGADIDNVVSTKGLNNKDLILADQLTKEITFLAVGTIEPRKRQAQVLDCFELLWKNDLPINLVFVGKSGWGVDSLVKRIIHHPEYKTHLFWLERISDEYLEKIYESSDCLIAASEDEGFGLPLIEAARNGLPIIARDIPVFREVVGENAYYFKGNDATDLVNAVENWIELYKNKKISMSNDIKWLTWEESAQNLIQCIISMR